MQPLTKTELNALEVIHRSKPEHLKALIDLIEQEAATNPAYKDRIYKSALGNTAQALISLLFVTADKKYKQEELENNTDYFYKEWRAANSGTEQQGI